MVDFESARSILETAIPYLTAPELLWAVFGVVFGIVAVISGVLYYHWRHYGMNRTLIRKAQMVYFSGTIALLLIGGGSLLMYFILT